MGGGVTDLTAILPRPVLRAESCTRRHGSGCAACADACPRDVWKVPSTDDPPRPDADACIGCALCVPACPVGAIIDVGPSAASVVEAAASAGGSAVVRCRVAQQVAAPGYAASVLVPCLGALDPETVAAAAVRLEEGTVTLERAACEACPVAPVAAVARVLRAGATLAQAVAPGVTVADSLLVAGDGPPAPAPGRPRSRRSLFRPLKPATPAPVEGTSPRTLLLAAAPDAPLPLLRVDDTCTGCGACSKVCPTGALIADVTTTGTTLVFDPRSCVDCGECARVCGVDAISVPGRSPGPHTEVVVARVSIDRCSRCQALLAPGEGGTCSRCRGRRGMLDDVWAALG